MPVDRGRSTLLKHPSPRLAGQKVRDIEANRPAELHLNSNPEGGDVVRIAGTAKIEWRHPLAHEVPANVRKYRRLMKECGWSPREMAEQYPVPIRIKPPRFH